MSTPRELFLQRVLEDDDGMQPVRPRKKKGGPGSGNFGHGGRPGKVGGSGGGLFSVPPVIDLGPHKSFAEGTKAVFGKVLTEEQVAQVCGALPGVNCRMRFETTRSSQGTEYIIRYESANDDLGIEIQERTVYREWDGKVTVSNDKFYMEEGRTGSGVGMKSFGSQVAHAAKHGVSKLETTAGGEAGGRTDMNGYYTWPRLGYDGQVRTHNLSKAINPRPKMDDIPLKVPPPPTVSRMMKTEYGRNWWKENGAAISLQFDLAPGSPSRKVFARYAKEKAKRKAAK